MVNALPETRSTEEQYAKRSRPAHTGAGTEIIRVHTQVVAQNPIRRNTQSFYRTGREFGLDQNELRFGKFRFEPVVLNRLALGAAWQWRQGDFQKPNHSLVSRGVEGAAAGILKT